MSARRATRSCRSARAADCQARTSRNPRPAPLKQPSEECFDDCPPRRSARHRRWDDCTPRRQDAGGRPNRRSAPAGRPAGARAYPTIASVTELVERYVRVQARVRDWIAAVPIWFWLATLVLVSAAVRLELALGDPGPWIFSDELYYAELAKSGAAGGFALREVRVDILSLGPVYPLLIAPAYALFERIPDAYDAARAINAVVMSLAALPAYLLARRVLDVLHSLGAALLTVALPSMLYTTVIMTENAFYPVFLACVLVMALALERPTVVRQLAVLALVLVAFLTRRHGIVLLPAYGTAILALAIAEGFAGPPGSKARWKASAELLMKFALTLAVVVVAASAFLLYQLAGGRSPTDSLLGNYASLRGRQYSFDAVFRWSLYHLGELDLYLGFAPLAALLV